MSRCKAAPAADRDVHSIAWGPMRLIAAIAPAAPAIIAAAARSTIAAVARSTIAAVAGAMIVAVAAPTATAQENLAGFPKFTTNDQTGAPLFFDMDQDGVDELVHANAAHTIDIWTAGGAAFPGFPAAAWWHIWNMTPAVGDIDADGDLEIVTACSGTERYVYAYHHDGTPVSGFPRWTTGENAGACCLADLDGDGALEILVQPRGRPIYAFRGDGSIVPGWPVNVATAEGGSQTPAVGDLDNDGIPEVVATVQGTNSQLVVVHPDGTALPGFPLPVVYFVGSPVLADLDRDGDLEIIAPVGYWMYAWHHDAQVVAGFPVRCGNYSIYASPAVGDIDRDGRLEIVFGSQGGQVYVVRDDGTLAPGWPVSAAGNVHATPSLADVDGDGRLEIFVTCPTSGSGGVWAWRADGTPLAGFPWYIPSAFYGGLTLGDLDGAGRLDFAAAARDRALYAWRTPYDYDPTRIAFGAYRMNRHNNGVVDLRPADAYVGVEVLVRPRVLPGELVTCRIRAANRTTTSRMAELHVALEAPDGARTVLRSEVVALPAGVVQVVEEDWWATPSLVARGYRVLAALRAVAAGGGAGGPWPGGSPAAGELSGDAVVPRVLHWDGELVSVPAGELKGDLNCDGRIDFGDINPFVLLLTDPAGWAAAYPQCPPGDGDINNDGRVNFDDINPFVALLTGRNE
ncbi:MAG: FG-GAP-like repeat-containing protein [Planctomycetota bacterium]